MATRSAIAIAHGDRIKGIYCHYDGYTAHNGYILQNYYNDSVLANKLISMGDASSIGAEIGEQHNFNERSEYIETDGITSVAKQCTFYNRDRGEDTSWASYADTREFVSEFRHTGAEYFYLFKKDKWFVKEYNGPWKLLKKALLTAK